MAAACGDDQGLGRFDGGLGRWPPPAATTKGSDGG